MLAVVSSVSWVLCLMVYCPSAVYRRNNFAVRINSMQYSLFQLVSSFLCLISSTWFRNNLKEQMYFPLPSLCSPPQRKCNFSPFYVSYFLNFSFVICGDRINVVSSFNKNLCSQSLILPPHLGLDPRPINLYQPSSRNNVGLLILFVQCRSRARELQKEFISFQLSLIKCKEHQVIRSRRVRFFF